MTHIDHDLLARRREDLHQRLAEHKAARQRAASVTPARALLQRDRKSATPREIIAACVGVLADARGLTPEASAALTFAVRAIGDLEALYQRECARAKTLETAAAALQAQLVQLRADNRALTAVAARPVASKTTIQRDAEGEMSGSETHYR